MAEYCIEGFGGFTDLDKEYGKKDMCLLIGDYCQIEKMSGEYFDEVGLILGMGCETAAIEIDQSDFHRFPVDGIKKPVLLITNDPIKRELLESIYGDEIPVREIFPEVLLQKAKNEIEEMEDRCWDSLEEDGFCDTDADSVYAELVSFQEYCESEGVDVFFLVTEKGEEVVGNKVKGVTELSKAILDAKDSQTAVHYYLDVFNNIEDTLSGIEVDPEIAFAVSRDIPKMAETVCCHAQNRHLDLHKGQFLKVNDTIYCIDAFV